MLVLSTGSNNNRESGGSSSLPTKLNSDDVGNVLDNEINSMIRALQVDKLNHVSAIAYPDSIKGLYRGSWFNSTSPPINSTPNDNVVVNLKSAPGRERASTNLITKSGLITIHLIEETTLLDDFKIKGVMKITFTSG